MQENGAVLTEDPRAAERDRALQEDRPGRLGRVHVPESGGRRVASLVGAWAFAGLTLLLLTRSPSASVLFFAVYPVLWLVTRTRWGGATATLVFSAGISLVLHAARGETWGDAAVNGVLSAAFSLFMGLWFWRVYEVSGQRSEALAREREAREALRAAQDELVAAEREAARTAEREQWARDVHDTLAQGFVSVITLAQAAGGELARGDADAVARRLVQLEEVARDNLAEARALVAGQGPADLLAGDLAAALARLVDEQRRRGRTASLDVEGLPTGLPRETQVVVLRVVQEALSNVTRHAGADDVAVAVTTSGPGAFAELVITVEDDGQGTRGTAEGTGLTGMRARVEALGGTVTVDPAHGPDADGSTGTLVEARIPL